MRHARGRGGMGGGGVGGRGLPLNLLLVLLLAGLRLHLLHLNGVGLAAAHVQLVVAHAQCQDALVDAQTRRVEHKVLRNRERRVNGNRKCLSESSVILNK